MLFGLIVNDIKGDRSEVVKMFVELLFKGEFELKDLEFSNINFFEINFSDWKFFKLWVL